MSTLSELQPFDIASAIVAERSGDDLVIDIIDQGSLVLRSFASVYGTEPRGLRLLSSPLERPSSRDRRVLVGHAAMIIAGNVHPDDISQPLIRQVNELFGKGNCYATVARDADASSDFEAAEAVVRVDEFVSPQTADTISLLVEGQDGIQGVMQPGTELYIAPPTYLRAADKALPHTL